MNSQIPVNALRFPLPAIILSWKIVNLSSKELLEEQVKFLSRGLKFTPKPKRNVRKVINADIQSFCRTRGQQESSFSDTEESLAKKESNSS